MIGILIIAHGTLAELYVLAQALPPAHEGRIDAAARAQVHLDALLGLASAASFDAYSVRHQLARYATWWWKDDLTRRALPDELVKRLDEAGVPARHDWT